jgi:hypothetical protein
MKGNPPANGVNMADYGPENKVGAWDSTVAAISADSLVSFRTVRLGYDCGKRREVSNPRHKL